MADSCEYDLLLCQEKVIENNQKIKTLEIQLDNNTTLDQLIIEKITEDEIGVASGLTVSMILNLIMAFMYRKKWMRFADIYLDKKYAEANQMVI